MRSYDAGTLPALNLMIHRILGIRSQFFFCCFLFTLSNCSRDSLTNRIFFFLKKNTCAFSLSELLAVNVCVEPLRTT